MPASGSPAFVKPESIPQALWDELSPEEKALNMQFVPRSAVEASPAPRRSVTFSPSVRPEGITQALWETLSAAERQFIAQSIKERGRELGRSLVSTAADYCRRIGNKDGKKESSSASDQKGLLSPKYIPASELAAGLLVGFLTGRELKKWALSQTLLYPVVSVPASYAALNKLHPERTNPASKWLAAGLFTGGTIGYLFQ